jgi:hypothetical protein
MKAGTRITVPDAPTKNQYGTPAVQPGLPGRWTVWSGHDDCPGAHAVVPSDDEARATGIKWAVVRITQAKTASVPFVQLRRTEPAHLMPAVRETQGAPK